MFTPITLQLVAGSLWAASVSPVMVETWQVVVAASGLLVTVLTVYGALIRRNYDSVSTIKQRLLGAEDDDTDDGFLEQTLTKLDQLGEKMDRHSREVTEGLQENRQRVTDIERTVERVEYKVDAVAQVVEDEHDVLFRGGTETDGGRPRSRENTRHESRPEHHDQEHSPGDD